MSSLKSLFIAACIVLLCGCNDSKATITKASGPAVKVVINKIKNDAVRFQHRISDDIKVVFAEKLKPGRADVANGISDVWVMGMSVLHTGDGKSWKEVRYCYVASQIGTEWSAQYRSEMSLRGGDIDHICMRFYSQ